MVPRASANGPTASYRLWILCCCDPQSTPTVCCLCSPSALSLGESQTRKILVWKNISFVYFICTSRWDFVLSHLQCFKERALLHSLDLRRCMSLVCALDHKTLTIFPPLYMGKSRPCHRHSENGPDFLSAQFHTICSPNKGWSAPSSSVNSSLNSPTTPQACLIPLPSLAGHLLLASSHSLPQALDRKPLVDINLILSYHDQAS